MYNRYKLLKATKMAAAAQEVTPGEERVFFHPTHKHPLTPQAMTGICGHSCDSCDKSIPAKHNFFGCGPCSHDVCMNCMIAHDPTINADAIEFIPDHDVMALEIFGDFLEYLEDKLPNGIKENGQAILKKVEEATIARDNAKNIADKAAEKIHAATEVQQIYEILQKEHAHPLFDDFVNHVCRISSVEDIDGLYKSAQAQFNTVYAAQKRLDEKLQELEAERDRMLKIIGPIDVFTQRYNERYRKEYPLVEGIPNGRNFDYKIKISGVESTISSSLPKLRVYNCTSVYLMPTFTRNDGARQREIELKVGDSIVYSSVNKVLMDLGDYGQSNVRYVQYYSYK
jgi:hypothetical protein